MKLAELFVDITGNSKPLSNTLAMVHEKLGMAGNAIAGAMTKGAAIGGAGLAAGLGYGIKKAVELQDTMSRNSVIFGDSSRLIEAQADQLADKLGVVKSDFMSSAGNFGSIFKGAGDTQKDAAILGNQLAKLAIDMRSFKGGATSTQETMDALGASLRGEFDPLERFGVFLSADKVAAEALSMGLAKSKNQLSDYAKKHATLSLIMKETVDQQGDAEKTGGQVGNQYEKLIGTLTNFATAVGNEVMPAINEWLVALNQSLKPAIETAGFIVRNFGDIWELAGLNISEQIAKIIGWVDVLPANLQSFADWLGNNWLNLMRDYFTGWYTIAHNAWDNILKLFQAGWDALKTGKFEIDFTPLLDGFEAATGKLPELIQPAAVEGFEQAREAILRRIGGREVQFAEDKAKAAAELAKAGEAKLGGRGAGAGKAAKTELVGVADFWKGLVDGKEKEQIALQKQQLEVQKKQLEALNKSIPLGKIVAMAAP